MGGSKETVLDDEAMEELPESPAARRRRLEKSLKSGLEDTFPASDAISVVQPHPASLGLRKSSGAE